jgi:Uma2 family endonuclease
VTVAPDLAVEVFSPSNTGPEMQQKADVYFKMGVRLVWVVYPKSRAIHVYTSPTTVIIKRDGDELDGGDVLPGFTLEVSDLFGDVK